MSNNSSFKVKDYFFLFSRISNIPTYTPLGIYDNFNDLDDSKKFFTRDPVLNGFTLSIQRIESKPFILKSIEKKTVNKDGLNNENEEKNESKKEEEFISNGNIEEKKWINFSEKEKEKENNI